MKNHANPIIMLFMITAIAFAATEADYSAALQTHFAKGMLGSPGKTRPIEMFFQNVFKSGKVYSVSGKSKTTAAEDAFSGTLTINSVTAGGSCASGEMEIKGSYNLNEKESKTSGYFAGSFTACEKSGKLSKASFKGDWVKHATGGKTPCSFELGSGGEMFKTVKIGSQTWMAENLNIKVGNSWCYDNNEANCKKYGRLYDWNTAVKACPSGWHLPSSEEWETLVQTAGGKNVAGKKLKSKTGWNDNGNGTDDFRFSAMPSGYRYYAIIGEGFDFIGYQSTWWSATESSGESRYEEWSIEASRDSMNNNSNNDETGFSVRCVMD